MKIITTAILLGITLLAVPVISYFFGTALEQEEWMALNMLVLLLLIVIENTFIVGELTGNNSQVDKLWSSRPDAVFHCFRNNGRHSPMELSKQKNGRNQIRPGVDRGL